MAKPAKKEKLICLCNAVSEKEIIEAIRKGAKDLGTIYDKTDAGVGACGGTCRPQLKKLLTDELKKK